MYVKIFNQIFDSSIADDYQVRLVFEDLLKLADEDGVVDMTHQAISRRTNVPIEIVNKGISALEQPDSRSRSPEHDGRRIVRLDEHRDWGWQIVNYLKYREIRDNLDRKEYRKQWMSEKRRQNPDYGRRTQPRKHDVNSGEHLVNSGEHGEPIQMQRQKQKQIHTQEKVCERETSSINQDAKEILTAYPLQVGKPAAIGAIVAALNRGYSKQYLKERAVLFTNIRAGNLASFPKVPNPATWFSEDRFADDESTWRVRQEEAPPAARLKSVEAVIKTHVCNPESLRYNPNSTDRDKADYRALKADRSALHAAIARPATTHQPATS